MPSREDPSYPTLERLLQDFPQFDAKVLVEEEDAYINRRDGYHALGPNPKIRNMSRAYREAKGDIIWIIDCNVWVPRSTCAHMVDLLCGFRPSSKKYKFVHQLPLVVDISDDSEPERKNVTPTMAKAGSMLEELFLSTSHAKFYTSISAMAVAPCIVGKSNMFRRSHLNALTAIPNARHGPGIDFFSSNICEDHLIGDLLWKNSVPASILELASGEGGQNSVKPGKWSNHCLLPHSLAIQPMAGVRLGPYLARRTRWLRVRKFTVPAATFVEPGTESLVCSLYGAYGFTSLRLCKSVLHIPQTWGAFWLFFSVSIFCWMLVDRNIWSLLQSGATFGGEEGEPEFMERVQRKKRRWRERIWAWVGREVLAGVVWVWAVCGGVEVVWRGRKYRVGWDASVVELRDQD